MRNTLYRWASAALVLVMLVSALGSARLAQAAPAAAPRPERKLPPLSETLAQIKSQVVVRFKEGVTADRASAAISATNGRVLKNLAYHNTKLAAYGTDAAASDALAKLNASEDVVYAFYNKRITIPRTQEPFEATAIGKRRAQRSDGQPLPQPAVRAKDVGYATGYRPSAAVPVDNSDPLRTYQYHLDRIGEPLAGAPEASAPTVAVIDSGLDYTVPDLSGAYQRCPTVPGLACDLVSFDQDPYDTNGHGTHVAGVIASRSNRQGARGVSPTSKILPVRIFGDGGSTDLVTIFEAIDYTVQAKRQLPSLRVANMSFGSYFEAGGADLQEFNERLASMKRAGVLPVVSAGNESDQLLHLYPLFFGVELRAFPAQSPYAFAVAATDPNDYRAFFSNYSTPVLVNSCEKFITVDPFFGFPNNRLCTPDNTYTRKEYRFAPVAAPGIDILAPGPRGSYQQAAGTSFSSPIVAGVAARVLAKYPQLTLQQAQNRIGATGTPLGIGKGFPRTTRRVDLRAALGNTRTGFTGRVVDGVTGQPLGNATVRITRGATVVGAAQTTQAGFYTITGGTGGQTYTITASKAAAPSYIPASRQFPATRGRLNEPGTVALAPARTDGAYTFMLEYNNVGSGILELIAEEIAESFRGIPEFEGDQPFASRYPLPVPARTQPFTFADGVFSVPYPGEPSDSSTFVPTFNEGSLSTYPFARIQHDSESGLLTSPHEGLIVRQLPPDQGPFRYGVHFLSPGGFGRSDAVVTVYRNSTRLSRARLDASLPPDDGTRGNGDQGATGSVEIGNLTLSGGFRYSAWGLYDLRVGYGLRTNRNSPNGARSDYFEWVSRMNDIRGQRGLAPGGSVTGRLDNRNGSFFYFFGCSLDCSDVYRVQLEAGKSYTFKLAGPAGTDFDLSLYPRNARSIVSSSVVAGGVRFNNTSNETVRYRVPAGRGGQYYLAVSTLQGAGQYRVSAATP